ncbi:MAG TPA: hypothetical protein VK687_15040 [Bryobacteraceae bacterium]|jgi:hypothetical protein|nr:hypothetical protein [Bryobacteraceae bacterium]
MPYRLLLVLFALLSTGAHAQWLNYSTPGVPRLRDGKPNLAAPAPRTADGKPNLSGVWHVHPTSLEEMKRLYGEKADVVNVPGMELDTISKYAINILVDFKPEESPIRPAAVEILKRRLPSEFPDTNCLPAGIPTAGLVSEPVKIVQSPGLIVMLYESEDGHRQIYTDGRTLPKEVAQPAWLGYSVGKWERDTLVVETAGFNDKSWLDVIGHPHSEALRVVERYHRRDFGHMDLEMTFDDPQMYTKPFTLKVTEDLLADSDLFESFCNENEKDRPHLGQQ